MIAIDPLCYPYKLVNKRSKTVFTFFLQFNRTLKLADGSTDPTRPIAMLKKIKRAKYPALTEEEEEMSLPLQVIYIRRLIYI